MYLFENPLYFALLLRAAAARKVVLLVVLALVLGYAVVSLHWSTGSIP